MDNQHLSQSITKLIAENISLVNQVAKHFEETQVLSQGDYVPLEHLKKLYRLITQHHTQTEKPSLLLLKILGQEVDHG